MLQDTGLGQEMFVSAYTKHENGIQKTLCYRYTDDLVDIDTNQENVIPTDHLCERTIVYCVSPPGETSWLKNSSTSEALNNINIQEKPTPLPQKFPLPGTHHTAAIIKFYHDSESLRVGQLVDVIGILGSSDSNMVDTMDPEAQFDTHLTQYKDVPVIHAITYSTIDGKSGAPFTKSQLDDMALQSRDIRGPLIDYIASYFGGDMLVAEFVLLQLLSKVSTQRHGLKIGQFCLNITNFHPSSDPVPQKSTSSLQLSNGPSQSVANMISNLVLHQVSIPLTLDVLNKSRFSPQSVNEDLISGVLQLVPGTHVLVDENELSEGQLGDTGVRNMQALINVIQHQTLTYGFPYSQFDFDMDLSFITLSSGKSLLPNHCVIPLKPDYALEQNQAENRTSPPKEELEVFRIYLQASKHASYEIPDNVSQYIQDDFVKERKQASERQAPLPSQEDLMMRMNLCRLVALSFGERVLTKETYDYTVQLDQGRKSRVLEHQQKTSN
ncbi:putative alanine racemase-domain-containing protein [Halteromyces radiatus]|uniref:putative alanine racemase-domain-containing protein n=1 Tax=Halteromyces radiatus TaxID=101107 RepID=UPI00221ED127|nr:putative alanine racemase-domain-containing protein [Halteromyces radiatus]KAI8097427.1 putative alanine racemase-domain-containing protein [Halteromyces radiatus]